jgi:hypothetical protein
LQVGWAEPRCRAGCPVMRPQSSSQRNRWRKLYRHKACVRDRQPKSDTHRYNRYVISNIDDACAGSTRGGCSEGHGPVDAGHGAFRSGPSTETRRRSSSDTSALIGAHSARWANGGWAELLWWSLARPRLPRHSLLPNWPASTCGLNLIPLHHQQLELIHESDSTR